MGVKVSDQALVDELREALDRDPDELCHLEDDNDYGRGRCGHPLADERVRHNRRGPRFLRCLSCSRRVCPRCEAL